MYIKLGSAVLLGLVVIYLFIVSLKNFIWNEKRVILGLFAIVSIALSVMIAWKSYPRHLLYYRYLMYLTAVLIPVFLVLLLHTLAWFYSDNLESVYQQRKKLTDRTALLSMILVVGLVFFCSPLTLHVSDAESMPFSGVSLILWHFIYSL